jgi:hypothetical protein
MQNWQSNIQVKLKKDQNSLKINPIKTAHGIFQGDPLRAFWFSLTGITLSNALHEKG